MMEQMAVCFLMLCLRSALSEISSSFVLTNAGQDRSVCFNALSEISSV